MRNAIVVDTADLKRILAERCGAPEENVIKSQYSFTVMLEGSD